MTLFDNCIIQAPDGTPLSRCSLKKAKWYERRGLADLSGGDPIIVKLRFEPSGRACLDDPLMTAGKPNHCVVCGTTEELTRHHVIPSSFIKHMDVQYKVDIIRDILPMCRDCHDAYEEKSQERRAMIAEEMGISLVGISSAQIGVVRRSIGAAFALLKHRDKIPEVRREELMKVVRDFLDGKADITDDDLQRVADHKIKQQDDYINFSQYVAESVEDYSEFAKEWRTHFVETMQPKYLPANWDIGRKTDKVWIPPRMLAIHKKSLTQ